MWREDSIKLMYSMCTKTSNSTQGDYKTPKARPRAYFIRDTRALFGHKRPLVLHIPTKKTMKLKREHFHIWHHQDLSVWNRTLSLPSCVSVLLPRSLLSPHSPPPWMFAPSLLGAELLPLQHTSAGPSVAPNLSLRKFSHAFPKICTEWFHLNALTPAAVHWNWDVSGEK